MQKNLLNENMAPQRTEQSCALGAFLLKDYDKANKIYFNLLEQNPDDMIVWTNNIICMMQNTCANSLFFEDMLSHLNRLPTEGLLCIANELYALKRLEEALVFLNKTLEQSPDNISACELKYKILDILGKEDELLTFLQSIFPKNKKDDRVLLLVALHCATYDNIRQAKHLYKQALKINKESTILNPVFYQTLLLCQKEETAIKYAKEALKENNDNAFLWLLLAESAYNLSDDENADMAYEKFSTYSELSTEVKFKWIEILINLSKHTQAFEILKTIPLNEDYEKYFLLLQQTLFFIAQENSKEGMLSFYEFLSKSFPDDGCINHLSASICQQTKTTSAPLRFIKIINDYYADLFEQTAYNSKEYKGVSVLENAITALKIPFKSALDILDLGCGSGALGETLKDYTSDFGCITGVDISNEALEYADENDFYDDLIPQDMMTYLSNNETRFDLITAIYSLFYFSDLTEIFKLVAQNLKQNGRFIFTILSSNYIKTEPFELKKTGQFMHKEKFVIKCLENSNLKLLYKKPVILRKHKDEEDINGIVFGVCLAD